MELALHMAWTANGPTPLERMVHLSILNHIQSLHLAELTCNASIAFVAQMCVCKKACVRMDRHVTVPKELHHAQNGAINGYTAYT